jgi:hypothetical protein
MPTMSRESLQMNDEAKVVIQEKCKQILADLQIMADAQVTAEDDLRVVIASQDFTSLPIPNSEKRIPMNWASNNGYGTAAIVKMKACVWSKFPTATISDISYYGKRILYPHKELSEGRGYNNNNYTFKSQNLSSVGINAVLGEEARRWDAPELVVRMPKDAKLTAADKAYVIEKYPSTRILFIKNQELEAPATFMKLAVSMGFEEVYKTDGSGELVDGHWGDVANFLFDAVGHDILKIVMENTTHWDDVKATPEYIEERKEAMKAARENVTKKERANDAVRVRGLGIHWNGDETIGSMIARQKQDKRGYVYCTKVDIDSLKELHKTGDYRYTSFEDFVRDAYEAKNVWLVAVNQKVAKQFAELDIFTSFEDYNAKREARKSNDGAQFMAYMESIQFENRMFIENLAIADPVFGAKYKELTDLRGQMYNRGMCTGPNPEDMQFPDTFQFCGNNIGVKFLKNAVNASKKLAENKPFLYTAFVDVKNYVDNRDAKLAEAFGYMFPNAQA